MGGSFTRASPKVGRWMSGAPIHQEDVAAIQSAIASGRIVHVGRLDDLPDGYEVLLGLFDSNGAVDYYAKQMDGFSHWWYRNHKRIISEAAESAGIRADVAGKVAGIAWPIIALSGADAARTAVNRELGDSAANDVVVDIIARQIGSHSVAAAKSGEITNFGHHYRSAAVRSGGHVVGSCGCGFTGGDDMGVDTVREYVDSANSKSKNAIIEDILTMATSLQLNTTGSTPAERVRSLAAALPAGKNIKDASDVQKAVCAKLATVINRTYGNEIIDPKGKPEIICQQVAELLMSLSSGMHSEFLAVYSDARRVLQNLHILKSALSDEHSALMQKVRQDADMATNVAVLDDLNKILLDEVERQIQMLSNLLNVHILPADRDLTALIHNKKNIAGYIEKIDASVGSGKFGAVIGDILRGLGMTANFALIIEKALKTIGMTVSEYAKSASLQKLREKIAAGLIGKEVRDEELHEYLRAADLLYKNFNRHAEISEFIAKQGQGELSHVHGAADEYHGSTLDKRVRDRKKMRNLIFGTFYRQVNDLFDHMVSAIDMLTMKVGTEIPLSEQLNSFREILQRINSGMIRNVRKQEIYYALIGYYNDAMSRSKKDSMIGELKMMSVQIDTLLEMPLYAASKQYFVSVQQQIAAIVSLIEKYSDEIAAKFGRGERKKTHKRGGADDIEENIACDGGDDTDSALDTIDHKLTMRTKNSKTIDDAIRQFDYKYRVAQIRSNMKTSAAELAHYAEKYEKNVAQSIANMLTEDRKIYDALHKHIADSDKFGDLNGYVVPGSDDFKDKATIEQQRNAAVKILDQQWDIKKKFWATVEAVDTYMKVFTDALVKHPDDIKEIKSMLDDIDIINNWYTENTGETVASVFSFFPSAFIHVNTDTTHGLQNDSVEYPSDEMKEVTSEHYYSKVAAQVLAGHNPAGNPYLVTTPVNGQEAMTRARKALHDLGVLKNILSIFSNVGARFGGEEIRKRVFMTPTQMYNNLVDYLVASAFAQGFGVGSLTVDASGNFSDSFSNSESVSVLYDRRDGSAASATGGRWNNRRSIDARRTPVVIGVTIDASAKAALEYHSIDTRIVAEINRNRIVMANIHRNDADSLKPVRDRVNQLTGITDDEIRSYDAERAQAIANNQPLPEYAPRLGLYLAHVDKGKIPNPQGVPSPPPFKPTSSATPYDRALIFKKRWGVWMRSCIPELQKFEGFGFVREDSYFVLIMKAMAAKILTVTGMYDVFDRPHEFNGLNPIRLIIGGANETPKVIADAVPLYLRLPLLAQFYRSIFGFAETDGDQSSVNRFQPYDQFRLNPEHRNLKISMIPDIDGAFAGLIRIVFRKNKFVNEADYSDDDLKELIREINVIYQRMHEKHPTNTVSATIDEFVAEINRRYGIVTKPDRDTYEREFGRRYDYAGPDNSQDRYTAEPDTPGVAILPGETDDELVRPSNAQRLLGETFDLGEASKKSKYGITLQHRDLMYRFRCSIDKYFESASEQFTFAHAIKSAQIKLAHEQSDETRFNVISSLVRGDNIYSKVESMKCILFHETVIGGLNVLSAVHSMLAKFKRRVHVIDIATMENLIWSYLSTADSKSMDGLVDHIVDFLAHQGVIDGGDAQAVSLVRRLLGYAEAAEWNGGHMPAGGDMYAIKGDNGVPIHNLDGIAVHVMRFPADSDSDWDGSESTGTANSFGVRADNVITCDVTLDNPLEHPQGSLASVLAGFKAADLKREYNSGKSTAVNSAVKNAAATFMRFIFNQEYIMQELLESVYGLSSDFQGLVTFKLEHGKLLLNCNGLKTLIEEMFQHVSYFMDLLRPHVSSDLFDKYIKKTTPGSYYWLQEQIMEKIIIGRPAEHATGSAAPHVGYANLDELSHKLSYTYGYLTRAWEVDGAGLAASKMYSGQTGLSRVNVISKTDANAHNKFDKVFARMVFYDGACPHSGIVYSSDNGNEAFNTTNFGAQGGLGPIDALHNPYDALHLVGAAKSKVIDMRFSGARFMQLYTWKNEFTYNRSAMFAFNQLVAKFIQSFYDVSNNKIYGGLINQFANGAFNQSIVDPLHTYPDTVPVWMTKYGSTRHDVPNTVSLLGVIPARKGPSANQSASLIAGVIEQYLTFGVPPDHTDAQSRARLLNPADAYNAGKWFDKQDAIIADVRLWANLVLHLLCKLIYEQFRLHESDDDIVPTSLLGIGAGVDDDGTISVTVINTVGDAKRVYSPTGQVMLQNIVDSVFATEKKAEVIFRMLRTNMAGNVLNTPATRMDLFDRSLHPLMNAFDTYASFPTNGKTLGSTLIYAMRLFPRQDDAIGRSLDTIKYNALLFAAITVRCNYEIKGKATGPLDSAQIQDALAKISADVAGGSIKATYTPPYTSQPKFTVTEEELMQANDEYLSGKQVNIAPDENRLSYVDSSEMGALKVNEPAGNVADHKNFGRRADPASILFTSLATILKSLTTSRNSSNQTLIYMSDVVADIPLYMKEKMRANLPAFRNLFKELMTRCDFIKRFMGDERIDLARSFKASATGYGTNAFTLLGTPNNNPWPYVLRPITVHNSAEAKTRFTAVLDSVITGCTALITGCEQSLRDIGDDPKYFETYAGSIKDYRAQYGTDPLMPLSSALVVLKNAGAAAGSINPMDLFPIHSFGEDSFKFMYGIRSLIGNPSSKPAMEHATGYTDIISAFNMQVDNKLQVAPASAEGYFSCFVRLLRYVFELKHVKGLLTPYVHIDGLGGMDAANQYIDNWCDMGGAFVRDDMIVTDKIYGTDRDRSPGNANNVHGMLDAHGAVSHYGPVHVSNRSDASIVADYAAPRAGEKYAPPVFAITRSVADVIRLTESSFKDDHIKELVAHICARDPSREGLEMQNIIDLGIVPINVHALMRDIPLANLYNYAYTYDRLIIELYYGINNANATKLMRELCSYSDDNDHDKLKNIKSSRDMIIALLLNPYMNLFVDGAQGDEPYNGINLYESYAKPMLLGTPVNSDIGRPKFLSDQIYNKVIFGELYSSEEEYNELGPAAAHNRHTTDVDHLHILGYVLLKIIDAVDNSNRFNGIVDEYAGKGPAAHMRTKDSLINSLSNILIQNPSISVNDLTAAISAFLDTEVGIIPNGVNHRQSRIAYVATVLSMVSKIVQRITYPMVKQWNMMTLFDKYTVANNAALLLHSLNALGSDARYPIIDGSSPENAFVRMNEVVEHGKKADGLTLPGGSHNADLIRSVLTELSKITIDESLISYLSGVLRHIVDAGVIANNILQHINNAHKHALVSTHIGSTRKVSNIVTPSRTKLHWLDTNAHAPTDAEIAEPGANMQPLPNGDNNVMDRRQIKSVDIDGDMLDELTTCGRMRFDTIFVRNLIFITNLYRSLRTKLQNDLMYNRELVASAAPVVRSSLTEFYGNEVTQPRTYDKKW